MKNHALRRIALLSVLLIVLTDAILTVIMSFYAYNIVSESTLAKAEDFHQAFSNLLPSLSIENIESIETDEIMREAFPEYIRGLFRFSEAKYLYLFQASHEENQIKYIFAIGADEQEDRKVFEERSRGTKVDIGERSYIDQRYGLIIFLSAIKKAQ